MTAIRRRGFDWLLNAYAGLALFYLLLPIAVIIVFSFNNPVGRFNFCLLYTSPSPRDS